MDDPFDAIAEELRREAAREHEGEAREIVAAGDADRAFVTELRRVPPGELVTVVSLDGAALFGRILAVGRDWIRVGEVADATGTARVRLLRIHDVRLDSIARVSREAGA